MEARRALVTVVAAFGLLVSGVAAAPTAPASAEPLGAGMAMVDAAWRAAFARQAEDGAAEAAADELEVEADPEDTGAEGDEVLAGPPVPGANPPAPDPEAVLPAPAPAREAEILGVVDQPAPPSGEAEIAPGADEIVSERTSRTKTFDNGDGSFTTETHVEPIHVRQQGEWVDIDPELEQTDDGTFVNGPALVDVELASDASADELVSVDTGEGSVAYGLEGADDVEAHVDGATAVYEDVLPGVDLELESVGSGLKETVVLESPSASSVLRFPLALQDVTASLDAAGGVVFESGDGEEVAVIPPGFMVDSAVGGGVRSDAVTYDIEGDGDDAVLVVTADRGWLDAPERVWPVRVDPTIVDRNPVDATYVKQTVTADHTGASELRVGLEAGKLTATYMRFQFGIPADSYVSAATLVAHNSYSVRWLQSPSGERLPGDAELDRVDDDQLARCVLRQRRRGGVDLRPRRRTQLSGQLGTVERAGPGERLGAWRPPEPGPDPAGARRVHVRRQRREALHGVEHRLRAHDVVPVGRGLQRRRHRLEPGDLPAGEPQRPVARPGAEPGE